MKKYKKCKGIGKAKDFKGCDNDVLAQSRKYGLCNKCYPKWLYTSPLGKKMIAESIKVAKKPRIELEKAKEEHASKKKLSWLIQNTVNACHDYIKARDKYKPCISCGENWHKDFQAGHFYKAELYSTLKLDETNIHGQCKGCNLGKEGNESGYRIGLIKRYSKGYLDLLDSKALLDKKTDFKWERAKLEEIRKYYNQKIKEIKC